MLRFIIGRSGSGKTAAVFRALQEHAQQNSAPLYLIVPEQASFDNEKRLLAEFGSVVSQRVQVLSFTRMAETVFSQIGGLVGRRMDTTVSLLLLSQALHSVADSLILYRRHTDNPEYLRSLSDFLSECKQCMVTPRDLETTAASLPKGTLRDKLTDSALIFGAYEALTAGADLLSAEDELTALGLVLPDCSLFNGAHIFLDSFKGFTEQEQRILEVLLPRVASMTVTLCTDTLSAVETFHRFSPVVRTATRLRDAATRLHVPVAAVEHLRDNHRAKDAVLRAVEAGCFATDTAVCEQSSDRVRVIACADRREECRFAAREIRRLLREEGGYARDFTVAVRNSDEYAELLESAFRREGLPYVPDRREPVITQPIITLLESALAAADRWDSADVLRIAKTGLTGFTALSAAKLEQYAFIWDIRGKGWKLPFTAHPEGIEKEETEASVSKLAYLNALRKRLVTPLIHLQTRLDGVHTGREFAEALWKLLTEYRVARCVRLQVARLQAVGEYHLADLQAAAWDYVVTLLDKLSVLTQPTTARQFAALLHVAVASDDLGSIPSTLDGVRFGSADRIRYAEPKTVFILGANEGVFPAYPSSGGLFGNHERKVLAESGLALADDADRETAEERFYAYAAVAAPSERLYVTYGTHDGKSTLERSTLVDAVCRIAGIEQAEIPNTVSESAPDAFERAAALWHERTAEAAAYRTVMQEDDNYRTRLSALSPDEGGLRIHDTTLATKLFGRDLWLSPSQVDKFFRCRFAYFCEKGLRIERPRRAVIGHAQAGTMFHYAMSTLIPRYVENQFEGCTKQSIVPDIRAAFEECIEKQLGGMEHQDEAFRTQLLQLIRSCQEVLWRIICELRQCRFVPTDYELKIGDELPHWVIPTDDGGSVRVGGSVDRVDILKDGERAFVRIIDYKTGRIDFSLGNIFSGQNLQMLIYLFSIVKNGQQRYGLVSPAGVLYLPSGMPSAGTARGADAACVESRLFASMQYKGLLLDNKAVLDAMEADIDTQATFLPLTKNKDGSFKKGAPLISAEAFEYVGRQVERTLQSMADALHRGDVDALPLQDSGVCGYCVYRDICRHEDGDPEQGAPRFSTEEAVAELYRRFDEEVR